MERSERMSKRERERKQTSIQRLIKSTNIRRTVVLLECPCQALFPTCWCLSVRELLVSSLLEPSMCKERKKMKILVFASTSRTLVRGRRADEILERKSSETLSLVFFVEEKKWNLVQNKQKYLLCRFRVPEVAENCMRARLFVVVLLDDLHY